MVRKDSFLPTIFGSFDRDEFLTPFDRFFDRVMQSGFGKSWNEIVGNDFFSAGSYPRCDVVEYKDKVVIEAEIPGLTKEDINIAVKDGVLSITGKKKSETEQKDGKYLFRELKRSSFARSFKLNENLDGKNVNALFKEGILIVEIPKVEPSEPEIYKVEIK